MGSVLLPILLLFMSFGLDYGRAFLLKHELQGAADAAALAGTSETEVHLVLGAGGIPTGYRPIINRALADAEANAVLDNNIALTKLEDQGVAIVNENLYAIDDTHYFVEVLADIETYISGPIMAMWTNDPSLKKLRVKRKAIAHVRL